MCHRVVLDDGIPYKIVFIAMYETLNLDHDVLTKRKHKDLTVERFHRFLNKISFIAAEERGTNDFPGWSCRRLCLE